MLEDFHSARSVGWILAIAAKQPGRAAPILAQTSFAKLASSRENVHVN